MYQKIRKRVALALACVCLIAGMPIEAPAATKPINTVNIKISSKIRPGQRLPAIQIGSGSAAEDGIVVAESGSHFTVREATWLDSSAKDVVAADQPRMKVVLAPEDVSEYYFLASYKASNVKISGGSFVSAKREGDELAVTLRLNPIKGSYDPPKDAYWHEKNLGEARWTKPENSSGYYEVHLRRGSKTVFQIAKTSSVSYNFYPYMTEPGLYSFRIRTIPGTDFQTQYGKRSDWIDSGELEIGERYVSDGKGQKASSGSKVKKGTEETTGWFKEGNLWKYRYPTGELSTERWEDINGKWYYFDGNSNMVTGWRIVGTEQYFFHDSGEMAVGWNRIGGVWYFFRTAEEEDGHAFGSMVSDGWRVIGPYYYFFNRDGSMYTGWLKQGEKWYYLNALDNGLQGAMFTGWIRRDEKTYFADDNGEIVEGWYQIDGLWYYFYPGSGEMARDTQIDGFPIDSDGIWR